jgi:hypothetical protein
MSRGVGQTAVKASGCGRWLQRPTRLGYAGEWAEVCGCAWSGQ